MEGPAPAVCLKHDEIAGQRYFLFFDSDRRFTHASQPLCELLGYTPEEMIGRRFADFVPEKLVPDPSLYRQFRETRVMSGIRAMLTRDGRAIGVRFDAFHARDGCMFAVLHPVETPE